MLEKMDTFTGRLETTTTMFIGQTSTTATCPPLPIYNPYFKHQMPAPRPQNRNVHTNNILFNLHHHLSTSSTQYKSRSPTEPFPFPRPHAHPQTRLLICSSTRHPSSSSSHFPLSHPPGHPPVHEQDHSQDHPFDYSPNPESKDLPHSIDIDHPRTKTMTSKRARHSSTDTELCNVMMSPMSEPRLKNRKVLTFTINVILDNDILPQLMNDFTEWT